MSNFKGIRLMATCVSVILTVLVLFAITSVPVLATTYYIDATGGNDANCTGLAQTAYVSGSAQACPWKTLSKVNTVMGNATITAGDTIFFKRGETFAGYLNVAVSGTAGNILTFDAYGSGEKPIFNGAGNARTIDIRGKNYVSFKNLTLINGTSTGILFYTGLDHIVVDNITVTSSPYGINLGPGTFSNITISNSSFGGTTNGLLGAAGTVYTNWTISSSTFNGSSGGGVVIGTSGTNTNISISDSQFNNTGSSGLYINKTNGLTISNSQFNGNVSVGLALYDVTSVDMNEVTANSNGTSGLYLAGNPGTVQNVTLDNSRFNTNGQASITGNGVSIAGNGSNFTATNVEVSNNAGDGFNIHDAWTNVIFDHCTASANGTTGATSDGDGFSFHDSSTGTIRYSVSKNNKKSGVLHVGNSQVIHYYNLFYSEINGTQPLASFQLPGVSASFTLYNNVIWCGENTGTAVGLDGTSIVKNNSVIGCDLGIVKAGGSTVTEDYNLVFGATTANYSGLTAGAHSIQADPQVTSATLGSPDFRLTASSLAINAGTDVGLSSDYAGNSVPQGSSPDIGAYEFLVPSSATSLTQYKSDASTALATGSTTNESTVVLTSSMTSLNASDLLTLQLEIRPIGTAFTNVVTNSGSVVASSGSPVIGSVSLSNLSNGAYHWQARVSNPAGQSSWVSYGGNAESAADFTINYNSPATSNSAPAPSVPSPHTCSDGIPSGSADLFQINRTGKTARLYFSPVNGNVSAYHVMFGFQEGDEHFSGLSEPVSYESNSGVQSITIKYLDPQATYWFKVAPVNGCAVGTWSNWLKAGKTGSSGTVKSIFYRYMPSFHKKK